MMLPGDGNKVAVRGRCRVVHYACKLTDSGKFLFDYDNPYVSRVMVNPTFNEIEQKAAYARRKTSEPWPFLECVHVMQPDEKGIRELELGFGS